MWLSVVAHTREGLQGSFAGPEVVALHTCPLPLPIASSRELSLALALALTLCLAPSLSLSLSLFLSLSVSPALSPLKERTCIHTHI